MLNPEAPKQFTRVYALDYLRGLLALGVLIGHYVSWGYEEPSPNSFFGRVLVYGVSMFFVISGSSLTIRYLHSLRSFREMRIYAFRRILRLTPVLWIATTFTLLDMYVGGSWQPLAPESLKRGVLNYSLTFGLFEPSSYIATGAWSIGAEVCFYLLFPWFLHLNLKHQAVFYWIFLFSFLCLSYFAFVGIAPTGSLDLQWKQYIHPLNHLFFFVSGIWFVRIRKKDSKWCLAALFLMVFGFLFLRVSEQGSSLYHGANRLVLSCLSVCIVGLIYHYEPAFPRKIHLFLKWLGDVSYPVYLLSPVVYRFTSLALESLHLNKNFWIWGGALPLSYLVAHLVWQYVERPVMERGKMEGGIKWIKPYTS